MLFTDGLPLHPLNTCVTLEKERGRDRRCRGERRRGEEKGERGEGWCTSCRTSGRFEKRLAIS